MLRLYIVDDCMMIFPDVDLAPTYNALENPVTLIKFQILCRYLCLRKCWVAEGFKTIRSL